MLASFSRNRSLDLRELNPKLIEISGNVKGGETPQLLKNLIVIQFI
jgi:hypothetical protein